MTKASISVHLFGTRVALLANASQSTRIAKNFQGVCDFGEVRVVECFVAINEGSLEGRNVDGVTDGEIHGGIDHVAKSGFVVLNRTSLAVTVAKENQLLLLTSPQGPNTFSIQLKNKNAKD